MTRIEYEAIAVRIQRMWSTKSFYIKIKAYREKAENGSCILNAQSRFLFCYFLL